MAKITCISIHTQDKGDWKYSLDLQHQLQSVVKCAVNTRNMSELAWAHSFDCQWWANHITLSRGCVSGQMSVAYVKSSRWPR